MCLLLALCDISQINHNVMAGVGSIHHSTSISVSVSFSETSKLHRDVFVCRGLSSSTSLSPVSYTATPYCGPNGRVNISRVCTVGAVQSGRCVFLSQYFL